MTPPTTLRPLRAACRRRCRMYVLPLQRRSCVFQMRVIEDEPSTKAIRRASLLGLACGTFWITLSFVFFTVPESRLLNVVELVAVVSCPAFLIVPLFFAPLVNAAIY